MNYDETAKKILSDWDNYCFKLLDGDTPAFDIQEAIAAALRRAATQRTAPQRNATQRNASFIREVFMILATVELESLAPYSQSRYHDEPKLAKESDSDYEARTWRGRMHVDKSGVVYIPGSAFKNCLDDAAKYLSVKVVGKAKDTYTKHFNAGVMVMENLSLGIKACDVPGEWLFLNSDGKAGSGKRVKRCMPRIDEWSGKVVFTVFDHTITKDIFKAHIEQAGSFIGIGRFRPRNRGWYGRFKVNSIEWNEL